MSSVCGGLYGCRLQVLRLFGLAGLLGAVGNALLRKLNK